MLVANFSPKDNNCCILLGKTTFLKLVIQTWTLPGLNVVRNLLGYLLFILYNIDDTT